MSRSGYSDDSDDFDDENNAGALYRANVERTIHGKRGQAFLREMAAALDAMPVKELIAHEFISETGCVCAMGAVAQARKLEIPKGFDEGVPWEVGALLRITPMLAAEIAYHNDERGPVRAEETPAQRWQRMRSWVREHVRSAQSESVARDE